MLGGVKNQLWYGDNLNVLRDHIASESVDLVYLDPPFNSNRSYNVLFKSKSGDDAMAQIEAFDDTWTWSQESEFTYMELITGGAPARVADAVESMRKLLGDNDVLAYLVMMTARLVELHRVLKPTGSLYLHCDPTASHYLKVVLDAIFGPTNYVSEISWKRSSAHNDAKRWGAVRDVIFYYAKNRRERVWNTQYGPYDDDYVARDYRHDDHDGRGPWRRGDLTAAKPGGDVSYDWRVKRSPEGVWSADPEDEYKTPKPGWEYKAARPYKGRYWAYSWENMLALEADGKIRYTRSGNPEYKRHLSEMPGAPISNHWDDIPVINSGAAERLGYPTQKPLALLERIVQASSNSGDVVLDPFCGCGTTIDAAQMLGRRWIGIDITYLSVDLIRKRLRSTHGDKVEDDFDVHGIPHDAAGAQALFDSNPFDFERWAVSLIDGQPNEKQVGDKGVDGVIRFPLDAEMHIGRVIVSVKGGQTVNPAMVRDLRGTVESQRAEMGILVTLAQPTRGMVDEARRSGSFTSAISGKSYPRIQIVTIDDLFRGKAVNMPTPLLPYIKAPTFAGYQLELGV